MKTSGFLNQLVIAAVVFVAGNSLLGCHTQSTHPDDKSAVADTLRNNNLNDIGVSQDREKGVITLTGNVNSQDQKSQAENLAKVAAPTYAIANEIGVRPHGAESQAGKVASSLDSGIEDNFKAALKAHKNLDDQSIDYSAKNGTLVLKGSVKTAAQKKEAGDLAKHIPNVEQVVNEIEIKAGKHSTARS